MLLVPSFGSFFVYTLIQIKSGRDFQKTICVQRKWFSILTGVMNSKKSLKNISDNEKNAKQP